jgi:hypothetical protein
MKDFRGRALVEVMLGSIIPKSDPSFAKARNIRRLHLNYNKSQSSELISIELTQSERQFISKAQFTEVALLENKLILPHEEKRVLKLWLAARHGRPAFPNAFIHRLKKDKCDRKLDDILKSVSIHLIGVFIDFGEERSIELPQDMPYCLRISIVYDGIGGPVAREAAEECSTKITALFHKTYGTPTNATELLLESCKAVADINFSIADLRKVDQWHTDYISLRETPPEALLAVGEATV